MKEEYHNSFINEAKVMIHSTKEISLSSNGNLLCVSAIPHGNFYLRYYLRYDGLNCL
jgi:hypothetical protein